MLRFVERQRLRNHTKLAGCSVQLGAARASCEACGPTLVAVGAGHEAHDYRESVSPSFRLLFVLQPDIDSMAAAPVRFHVRALVGMLLFATWPFTRLVTRSSRPSTTWCGRTSSTEAASAVSRRACPAPAWAVCWLLMRDAPAWSPHTAPVLPEQGAAARLPVT